MKKSKISIIIPHLNEWYYLDIMLDSFYNYISYDNYEIIIVDDGSKNISHLDFINNHFLKDKIKLFKEKWLWLSKVKNFWAKNSSWDILIFLDSHMYIKDDILSKINNIFIENSNIDLLQPVIWSILEKDVKWEIYKIKDFNLDSTWDNSKNNDLLLETPNIAWWATIIKKEVFDKLWWFNQKFKKWWVEDLEFSMRAWLSGYNCYLSKDILINHYFKESFKNTTINSEDVLFNKIIFTLTCFNSIRKKNILNKLKEYYWDIYDNIFNKILKSQDINNFIEKQKRTFIYDDNWYFGKFKDYYLENFK